VGDATVGWVDLVLRHYALRRLFAHIGFLLIVDYGKFDRQVAQLAALAFPELVP
jgi:hypothetical protein